MNHKIKVTIDADLEAIIPEFLKNREKDIASIDALLRKKDYDGIRMLGHKMKGAGASYGFDVVSDIGRAIEAAAKQEAAELIAQKKAALADFLNRLDIEYVQE